MKIYKKITVLLSLCLLISLSACRNNQTEFIPLGGIVYIFDTEIPVLFAIPPYPTPTHEDSRAINQKYTEAFNEYIRTNSKSSQEPGSEAIFIYLESVNEPRLITSYDTDFYSADEIALLVADFRKAIEEYEIEDYQKFGEHLERIVKKFEKSKK